MDEAFVRKQVAQAMDAMSTLYGQPTTSGFLRFIYSPRSGWDTRESRCS
jgi:hypothetical protein